MPISFDGIINFRINFRNDLLENNVVFEIYSIYNKFLSLCLLLGN